MDERGKAFIRSLDYNTIGCWIDGGNRPRKVVLDSLAPVGIFTDGTRWAAHQ